MTYPVDSGRVGMEGEKVAREKVTKRRSGRREWYKGGGQGPLAKEGDSIWIVVQGSLEFLVMQLLMVPVCLLNQGRV